MGDFFLVFFKVLFGDSGKFSLLGLYLLSKSFEQTVACNSLLIWNRISSCLVVV